MIAFTIVAALLLVVAAAWLGARLVSSPSLLRAMRGGRFSSPTDLLSARLSGNSSRREMDS